MRRFSIVLCVVGTLLIGKAFAQEEPASKEKLEELKGQVEGMDELLKTIDTDVAKLKKIKISGYLQIQAEKTEKHTGFATDPYDGKDYIKGRLRVRRSRIKVAYEDGGTQAVIQGDFSNSGFSLKDAYLEFTEPWTSMFALRLGVFNRPNYEVEYSSSQRESPERSAVVRALYPDERDLGVMLTVMPEDLFTLQLAGFNNTFQGTYKQQNPNFGDNPFYYMARLTKSFVVTDEIGLDLGVHGRFGTNRAHFAKVLESDMPTKSTADSTSLKVGDGVSRTWFGVEAQVYWDFLGGMKIMGEYIMGSDVDEFKANTAIRKRDFNGFYVYLIKNLGTDFQLALKYDSFNPNTKIDENKKDASGELKIDTFGFGLHNYTFTNIRLTLWYDMITTQTNDLFKNDPVDNLLTFRAQYKF